jgi:glycerophosphoryl diester phosphodiesterase
MHSRRQQKLAAVVAALVVCAWNAPPSQAAADPLLTAHRGIGNSATIPENTIPAFRYAADHGANFVELDVQLSSDGKMVVIHDKTLDRTTNCTGYVKDQTLAYINACDTETRRVGSAELPAGIGLPEGH